VATRPDADSPYDGIWANEVALGNGSTVSAWDFRNAYGLPAPGFELVPITRQVSSSTSFAFIGDSVGESVAGSATSPLRTLLDGVYATQLFDAVGGRMTQGGKQPDGVAVAQTVPAGTDLVVVELGYNDMPSSMSAKIDAVMAALRAREVGLVVWVNVSERRTNTSYGVTNAALTAGADRWNEMVVLDWNAASGGGSADRWYSDGVHLTSTGRAQFSMWLRQQVVAITAEGYTPARRLIAGPPLRVPVGASYEGASGVALNVTSVLPDGPGFLRVWPCAESEPDTSSVNFVAAGSVEPNAVVVPLVGTGDDAGVVCVSTITGTDVLVDVSAVFSTGVSAAAGRLVDTRYGIGPIPPRS
jgi:hypothetical protein